MNELRSDGVWEISHAVLIGKHFEKENLYVISHLSLPDGGSLARRTAAEMLINVYVF